MYAKGGFVGGMFLHGTRNNETKREYDKSDIQQILLSGIAQPAPLQGCYVQSTIVGIEYGKVKMPTTRMKKYNTLMYNHSI